MLRKKFKDAKDSDVSQRLRSLMLLKEVPDKKQADIAEELCIGNSTLKHWYKKDREHGFEKFIQLPKIGGRRSIVPEYVHLEPWRKNSTAVQPHCWVIDNAGFHSLLQYNNEIPDNIKIVRIPPYSPELNPSEKMWAYIKQYYKNKFFESLNDVEQWLANFVNDKIDNQVVKSITHNEKYYFF